MTINALELTRLDTLRLAQPSAGVLSIAAHGYTESATPAALDLRGSQAAEAGPEGSARPSEVDSRRSRPSGRAPRGGSRKSVPSWCNPSAADSPAGYYG